MYGTTNTSWMGLRVYSGGGSYAVRRICSEGPGSCGARAAPPFEGVLPPPRGGSLPLPRQNTRQVRLGHTRALRWLKHRTQARSLALYTLLATSTHKYSDSEGSVCVVNMCMCHPHSFKVLRIDCKAFGFL